MDQEEIRNVIEAALFAAEMPLSMRRLLDLFDGGDGQLRSDLDTVLASLTDEYKDRGIELVQVAEGYRFQTREQYAPWLRRMHGTRSPRYSKALLETLAIIAYRQPVTRGDIEEVRGVSVTTDIMRTLLDREWVSQKGVREVPGRPALYVTSSKFLEYFGLMRLADLPALGEQRQLNEIARELGIILPTGERDVVVDDIVPEDNISEDIVPVAGDNLIDHSHVSIGETSPAIDAESEVDVEGGDADRLLEAEVSAIG